MDDLISRQAAIDAICKACSMEGDYHKCDGYPETSTWCDELVALRALPSAQPEQIARDIATIIENEQDMRVLLKNTERTEKHDLVSRRAAIKTAKNVAYYVDEHGSANGWLAMLVNWLEILPPAQPQRMRGKWIGGELGRCSICGHEGNASDIWNGCKGMFFPNCGADMRGDSNG